jgi:hypothetical protein
MITESYYWKKPLLTSAKFIQRYMDAEKVSDAQFARIEREIFIGFYSIRKILEATAKVSAQTREMKVALKWFPKKTDQPPVDWYNRNEFCELYNLEQPVQEFCNLLYVSHRMVHSFIFSLSGDDDGHGAFFTSDRDKESRLNFLSTNEMVNAWRDPGTREMKWGVGSGENFD